MTRHIKVTIYENLFLPSSFYKSVFDAVMWNEDKTGAEWKSLWLFLLYTDFLNYVCEKCTSDKWCIVL